MRWTELKKSFCKGQLKKTVELQINVLKGHRLLFTTPLPTTTAWKLLLLLREWGFSCQDNFPVNPVKPKLSQGKGQVQRKAFISYRLLGFPSQALHHQSPLALECAPFLPPAPSGGNSIGGAVVTDKHQTK